MDSRFSVKEFFALRAVLSGRIKIACELIGTGIILAVWIVITEFKLISPGILPSPIRILKSFKELHFQDALIRNVFCSLKLNLLGYLEAVLMALPLGFLIGLISPLRATLARYIASARFLPLTAVIGIFIAWFGIGTNMKVQFLSFSIFIYLLPAVIERIDEVEEIYVQTAITLGASSWQIIKSVYIPSVISRVFDDIKILAALSWTYIIIAELVNASGGGIGALAYLAGRYSRADKVFAILIVIMIIGWLQDKFLTSMEKVIFRYKA